MCAFLTNPSPLPFRSRSSASVCPRRPLPTRQRAHIRFSAATDELRSVDNPQSTNDITPPISARPSKPEPPSLDLPVNRPTRFNRHQNNRDRSSAPPPFVPDPAATYYTKCTNCQAAYEIDPLELGRGRKVSCPVCDNQWYQKPDRLAVLKETEGFKAYPMEQKDTLISQARQERREERRDTPRGPRRDNNRRSYRSRQRFSIFVGNLPFNVTEDELEQLIKTKVNVLRVSVVKDPSGRSKGFAFADVASEEQVQIAVDQFNGTDLGGRAIAVRPGRKNT